MLAEMDQFDETTQRLPLETLQNMELPKVPENLKNILSINWIGRGGLPAVSAVAAHTNKKGQPLVCLSLVWHNKIIEEEYPFKDAVREFEIFSEVAQENLI